MSEGSSKEIQIPQKKGWRIFRRQRHDKPPPDEQAEPQVVEFSEQFKQLLERPVSREDLSIYRLPIGWGKLDDLAREVNSLKDDQLERADVLALRPPPGAEIGLPMVASVIARKRNPHVPLHLPTPEEVKQMKPWLRILAGAVSRFSQEWGRKLNRYIEKEGGRVVTQAGEKGIELAELFAQTERPREEFVSDVHEIYEDLAEPFYTNGNDLEPIESKLWYKLNYLQSIKEKQPWAINGREHEFPFLRKLLPLLNFPSKAILHNDNIPFVGAELMSGVAQFLRNERVTLKYPVPRPQPSFFRFLAEWFASERLEAVKRQVPPMLTSVKQTLPVNGPQFADAFYQLCENIVIANHQGMPSVEIVDAMFTKK